MKGLTDIPGIRVGQISDKEALTGCTAIICGDGAVGGVDIRGFATGTEEIDTLRSEHVADLVNAIVLSGGSAFGLEAASGVRLYLEQHGIGFPAGSFKVPIVPAAILFDLPFIGKSTVRPGREMGYSAAASATDRAVEEGNVGAGTGATVGKIFGMQRAMKGGIGTFTIEFGPGVLISALVVVNPLGEVRDPATGKCIAGARKSATSRELADSEAAILAGAFGGLSPHNTTLAVVATNAKLSKVGAAKLAQMASLGMARTIYPVNTMSDGDVTFALSLGNRAASIDALGIAAADAVARSIVRAVRAAKTAGGVPGLASG